MVDTFSGEFDGLVPVDEWFCDGFNDSKDANGKDTVPCFDEPDSDVSLHIEDTILNEEKMNMIEGQLQRLPTGKSMRRLANDYFRQIHDSASRTRETFFNLQGALRYSSDPD